LDDPAKFWEPVVGPLPLDGVVKARDCRSDRLVQRLDDGLQMRHLAPEPIVDVGVVLRWLWRLSPCISLDFFRHRVSSSDERRRPMTQVSDPKTCLTDRVAV